jgi:hypothetical protein
MKKAAAQRGNGLLQRLLCCEELVGRLVGEAVLELSFPSGDEDVVGLLLGDLDLVHAGVVVVDDLVNIDCHVVLSLSIGNSALPINAALELYVICRMLQSAQFKKVLAVLFAY